MAELTKDDTYRQAMALVEQILQRATNAQSINDLPLRDVVLSLHTMLQRHPEPMTSAVLPHGNHYLERHIVNTCLLVLMTGHGLHLNEEELIVLGMCALLYDVGMAKILHDDVSQAAGRSTLFDDIKHHPEVSVECLTNMQVQMERAFRVAGEHHERLDGSGYPKGISGNKIDFWSQIIGLADLYESFTHPRGKRQHQPQPHDFLRELVTQAGQFDQRLVREFVSQVGLYPVGTWVRLNTGAVGQVCGVNRGVPLRPIVQVHTENNQVIDPPRRVDLRENPVIHVRRLEEPPQNGGGAVT